MSMLPPEGSKWPPSRIVAVIILLVIAGILLVSMVDRPSDEEQLAQMIENSRQLCLDMGNPPADCNQIGTN